MDAQRWDERMAPMKTPTPRMLEIAAAVKTAHDAERDDHPQRDTIVEDFHDHSMERIVYLLAKLGVEIPS